jgi:hypothetical protein
MGLATERSTLVMAGLVSAIYVFDATRKKGVDARHKAGHDEPWVEARAQLDLPHRQRRQAVLQCLSGDAAARSISATMTAASALLAALAMIGNS